MVSFFEKERPGAHRTPFGATAFGGGSAGAGAAPGAADTE